MRVASFKLGFPPGEPRSIPGSRPGARRVAFARRQMRRPRCPDLLSHLRTSLATHRRRRKIHS